PPEPPPPCAGEPAAPPLPPEPPEPPLAEVVVLDEVLVSPLGPGSSDSDEQATSSTSRVGATAILMVKSSASPERNIRARFSSCPERALSEHRRAPLGQPSRDLRRGDQGAPP